MWWPGRAIDSDPFAEFDGRAPRRRAADPESEAPIAGARVLTPRARARGAPGGRHTRSAALDDREVVTRRRRAHARMHARVRRALCGRRGAAAPCRQRQRQLAQ